MEQESRSEESKKAPVFYTLKKVTKPLASAEKKEESSPSPVRLINEDDDGYDPYSDYVPKQKFFEENPWD